MNELPKSVRDELARQQQSGAPHPDADLLTAFSEGSATPAERARIEQHLASCSECREVIFLAAPPVEATTPVIAVAPKKTRWFPAWTPWAAAAAILIVASATLTREPKAPSKQARLDKNERILTPVPQQAAPPEAPTKPDSLHQAPPPAVGVVTSTPQKVVPSLDATRTKDKQALAGRRDQEFADEKQYLKKEESKALPSGNGVANLTILKPGVAAQKTAAAPAAVGGQLQENNRASRNTSLKPGPAAPTQNQMVQNQQNQVPQAIIAGRSSETVEVTSEAAAPVTQAKAADSISTYGAPALAAKTKVSAQWRISADGKLERTTAAGIWTTALAQPGTNFKVVAVIGPIVWTGGTHGALFRSIDGGATFQPIQLPNVASGSDPTITHIEFRDAWNGAIITADHRSWTTKDRGETWQQR